MDFCILNKKGAIGRLKKAITFTVMQNKESDCDVEVIKEY
jgi:hypothetical protein